MNTPTDFDLIAFRHIVEKTSRYTGEKFLRSLAERLSEALSVGSVLVTEFFDNNERARSRVLFMGGRFLDNIEYELKNTPCEDVIHKAGDVLFISDHVITHYPLARILEQAGTRSYIGVVLKDDKGSYIGHLAAFDINPIAELPEYEAILKIFADRAGAEILRMDYEEKLLQNEEKLRGLNANLERLVDIRTKELLTANKELDNFLYRSSHDLKGPVSRIKGLLNLLKMKDEDEYLNKIDHEVETIYQIIGKLETVAYIDSDFIEQEEIDFDYILRELEKEFGLNNGKIKYLRSIDEKGTAIHGHPGLLKIVLSGLLSNAVKFSQGRPFQEIKLSLMNSGNNKFSMVVEDNGDGIPEGLEEKVFDMFFRASEKDGIGLGLYLVRLAVQRMDGEVSVSSRPGKSTKVTVSLPIASMGKGPTLSLGQEGTVEALTG